MEAHNICILILLQFAMADERRSLVPQDLGGRLGLGLTLLIKIIVVMILNTSGLDKGTVLSTLWIFVTLNYLYCDLIGLMDANLLHQYMSGSVEGMDITPRFLFYAGILMEIPISMVLLSRILADRYNQVMNMVAAFVKTVVMVATLFLGTPTYYYLFFAIIEILTTTYIFYFAIQWRVERSESSKLTS